MLALSLMCCLLAAVVGLVVLVLLEKKKATDDGDGTQGQTVSLADRLRPQVEAAIDNTTSCSSVEAHELRCSD